MVSCRAPAEARPARYGNVFENARRAVQRDTRLRVVEGPGVTAPAGGGGAESLVGCAEGDISAQEEMEAT